MAFSVAESHSDGTFPVAKPEGARLRIPFEDYRRLGGRNSDSTGNG